jgi:hypothetical protein
MACDGTGRNGKDVTKWFVKHTGEQCEGKVGRSRQNGTNRNNIRGGKRKGDKLLWRSWWMALINL